MIHQVTDDSGFLAIVDTAAYSSFLSEDWDFDSLSQHFVDQMRKFTLLIWSTGREETWRVSIEPPSSQKPSRAIEGFIRVTAGRIHLTNYEDLSMAAQFRDVALPMKHNQGLVFDLPSGSYKVLIVPKAVKRADPTSAHFVLNFLPIQKPGNPWSEIPDRRK